MKFICDMRTVQLIWENEERSVFGNGIAEIYAQKNLSGLLEIGD